MENGVCSVADELVRDIYEDPRKQQNRSQEQNSDLGRSTFSSIALYMLPSAVNQGEVKESAQRGTAHQCRTNI